MSSFKCLRSKKLRILLLKVIDFGFMRRLKCCVCMYIYTGFFFFFFFKYESIYIVVRLILLKVRPKVNTMGKKFVI